MLANHQLGRRVPLLFLANKMDLPSALTPVELAQVRPALGRLHFCSPSLCCMPRGSTYSKACPDLVLHVVMCGQHGASRHQTECVV
jgi:hypothetical protein